MPSIVAIVVVTIFEGRKAVKELIIGQTRLKIGIKWFLISLIGIPLIALTAIFLESGCNIAAIGLRPRHLDFSIQMIFIIIIALGEEYGWRGFLQPRLMKRFNLFKASLIVGIIWGLWHLPAYFIGTGVPNDMNFLVFFFWVLVASLFIGFVYYYTKSVVSAILIHISANASFNYFQLLPEFTGDMNRFWIFLILFTLIVLIMFYLKRQVLIK